MKNQIQNKMEFSHFIKVYRDDRNLSARAFSDKLSIPQHRIEKWEKGSKPNYEDSIKILNYFGVDEFEKLSENFLKNFKEGQVANSNNIIKGEEILILKDQLLEEKDKRIEEKDKRISNLEETIKLLRSALADCDTKVKS